MHKKGITEEVAKKRSRKNVKVQVGYTRSGMGGVMGGGDCLWTTLSSDCS